MTRGAKGLSYSRPPRPPAWPLLLALILGLAAGIGGGLAVTWWLWPVQYTDVAPDSLQPAHREEYLTLVSQAFIYDHDLSLAERRLAALGDSKAIGAEIAALAERYLAQGGASEHIGALATLSYALGYPRADLAAYLPREFATLTPVLQPTQTPKAEPAQPPTETPSSTPTGTPMLPAEDAGTLSPEPTGLVISATASPGSTRTVRPTVTPTVAGTPEPRYQLVRQDHTCDGPDGLLKVTVLDAAGEPKPNTELLIRWNGGEERFFTGLKPENGLGYADYRLQKGQTCQVGIVGALSDVATGIAGDVCDPQNRLASWEIVFQLANALP
jgi:hypothetical protein